MRLAAVPWSRASRRTGWTREVAKPVARSVARRTGQPEAEILSLIGAAFLATTVMAYDNQTRSMLQTGQPKPDLGSQSGTVQASPDGSTDVYFGPTAPDGKATNWIQTIPGKGFFTILRLYNPEAPFFDKTWRPSEIEPI